MDIGMLDEIEDKYNGYMLMKFTSSYKFQQDFLDGNLFFNTSDFFAKCDNDGQGDPDEGNTFVVSMSDTNLTAANLEYVDGKLAIVVRDYSNNPNAYKEGTVWSMSSSENRNRKLICLYTMYVGVENNEIAPFPKQMGKEFGEYGILILDRQEFFERVCQALKNTAGIKNAQMGFVEYLQDNQVKGLIDWNPFMKMPKYRYQNEFRITFINDTSEPIKLCLEKDLRDIAVPIMAKDVDEIFMKNSKIYYPIYRKKNGVDVMALLFQKLSNSIKNVFKLKR